MLSVVSILIMGAETPTILAVRHGSYLLCFEPVLRVRLYHGGGSPHQTALVPSQEPPALCPYLKDEGKES